MPELLRRHEVGEAPGPLQVEAVPRQPVEEEEGVAVAGHAVADPGALPQQPLLPYALAASVRVTLSFCAWICENCEFDLVDKQYRLQGVQAGLVFGLG